VKVLVMCGNNIENINEIMILLSNENINESND